MMSELRRSSRRTSANVSHKEDAPIANGVGRDTDRGKDGQKNGVGGKTGKPVGIGGSSKAVGRGKRKIEYDEEDDGFAFARTRSKKAKAETSKQADPVAKDVQEEKIKPAPAKRPRKKSVDPASAVPADDEPKEKRRRSPRNSGDHQTTADPPPIQVKKRRSKETKTVEPKTNEAEQPITATASARQGPKSPEPTDHHEISWDATKIALPFADTPIIRRNKEMRKGAGNGDRRSSLGMRGRRASSLIDSGKSNALPHDEVDSSEFYKHIESGLPEPRRMRQLLTWCGTRALGEKPSSTTEDYHAGFAAREIQQQLLKDFSTKSEMSDWFSRKESTPPPRTPKPNPKNTSNLAKIEELEQQIAHLQIERHSWESLLRPPTAPLLSPSPPTLDPTTISPDLLAPPSQTALLAMLVPRDPLSSTDASVTKPSTNSSPANPSTNPPQSLHVSTTVRLQKATHGLEFEIDKFADNVQLLGSHIDGADRMADEVLGLSAAALEERDRAGRERAGGADLEVRDVLRGLSRVVD